jgi:hypothetical protein
VALAVDASTPARATGAATNGTLSIATGSFSPPACVLVACVDANARPNGGIGSMTNTGPALTWTKVAERSVADSGGSRGYAGIFVAPVSTAPGSMTVTATVNSAVGTAAEVNEPSVKVYVVTGANLASPVGAFTEGSSTANGFTTTAITTQSANSMLFAVAIEWATALANTSSDLTFDQFADVNSHSAISGYKTLGAAGTSATATFDTGGTAAAEWNWVTVEIQVATAVQDVGNPFPHRAQPDRVPRTRIHAGHPVDGHRHRRGRTRWR